MTLSVGGTSEIPAIPDILMKSVGLEILGFCEKKKNL